ncbi:hypothetical protein [Pseudomonas fluorescens]|uniref:Lipoprotein n=1 Tax=Pseudomonas fluorescens TaxID=294 RepID=A0A5E7FQ22_PSEFL|nr:hypothetical protein [Pseudomonas fluorescens]VVO41611.1 hypothetical protein PS691_05792 [Pseudomonas fluorescens]
MPALRNLTAAVLIALTTGCATGLDPYQEAELANYRANNLAVQEKSTALAAGLGLLPGVGSFYGRAYGYGVANLLLWPFSMIWDPISGHHAAEFINYQATKAHITKLKRREVLMLDNKLDANEIDLNQYAREKQKVEEKYSYTL